MKLLTLLLEFYKEEYDLNLREGEIKTTPIGQSIDILHRRFPNYEIYSEKDENTFEIDILKSKDAFSLKDAEDLLVLLNNLGWFISYMKLHSNTNRFEDRYNKTTFLSSLKSEKIHSIFLRCEAKFDFKVNKIPKTLYHIAPLDNWKKIEDIGLVPKSRSKASYHPERVYLAKTEKVAEQLAYQMYSKTGIKKYAILKIDTDMIPGEYFKLYQDPNYLKAGYYTLNNIPPIALEKIKDIEVKSTYD